MLRVLFGRRYFSAAVLLATTALSGCDSPVQRIGNFGSHQLLALDASQRLVVSGTRREYLYHDNGQVRVNNNGDPIFQEQVVICAEPSPDAIVATASYFTGGFNGGNGNRANAAGGFNQAVASIGLRTQTIQLLRDGYFRVCEAYLNGAIGNVEYIGIVQAIDHFMVVLVGIEAIAGSPSVAPVSISSSVDITQAVGEEESTEIDSNAASAIIPELNALTASLQQEAQANQNTAHQSEAIRQIVIQFLHFITERNAMIARARMD